MKWVGQCPSCGQWNSFVEELMKKDTKSNDGWRDYNDDKRSNRIISLNDIKSQEEKRLVTQDAELNRVLG